MKKNLSFSLSSKSSSSSRPLPAAFVAQEQQPATSATPELVTVFDSTVTLAVAAPAASIPPLPNTGRWRSPDGTKNLLPPPESPSSEEVAARFDLDSSQPGDAGGSYGLTLRYKGGSGEADGPKGSDRGARGDGSEPSVSAEQKFREDMERLPEHRGMDEFREISVEEFGRALLAGYGWKAGRGIGRNAKEDTHVKEYKGWAGNGGLGFKPGMAVRRGH